MNLFILNKFFSHEYAVVYGRQSENQMNESMLSYVSDKILNWSLVLIFSSGFLMRYCLYYH